MAKTALERKLYEKYALHMRLPYAIPEDVVNQFLRDVKTVKESEEYKRKVKN